MTGTYRLTRLVISALAKVAPIKLPDNHSEIDFETLKKKYEKWDKFSGISLIIVISGMTYLLGLIFSTIFYSPENNQPDIIYHIGTSRLMWFMPGLVLSFGLVRYPMTFISKLIFKDDYNEFLLYKDLKTGADGMKIMNYMTLLFGLGSVLLLGLLSDYSVDIYKDKIVLNDFLTLTNKTYAFSEIQSINYIKPLNPKTGTPESPYHFIRFNDHGHWDTSRGLEDDNNRQDEIINYLSKISGLKINVLQANPE